MIGLEVMETSRDGEEVLQRGAYLDAPQGDAIKKAGFVCSLEWRGRYVPERIACPMTRATPAPSDFPYFSDRAGQVGKSGFSGGGGGATVATSRAALMARSRHGELE